MEIIAQMVAPDGYEFFLEVKDNKAENLPYIMWPNPSKATIFPSVEKAEAAVAAANRYWGTHYKAVFYKRENGEFCTINPSTLTVKDTTMFSPTDEKAPPMPKKEQPTPDGYPIVPMLGNRLTDIENSLNHIIRIIGEKAFSPPRHSGHCSGGTDGTFCRQRIPPSPHHQEIPSMKLRYLPIYHPCLTAMLIIGGMLIAYYAATYAAHLYFSHRYPNHGIHTTENANSNLYAEIISTNLVSVPCPCGYCKPDQGIAVPEHINQIGYDLKVVVSTSYYPIVIRPSDFR